jgi:hypothetical protein
MHRPQSTALRQLTLTSRRIGACIPAALCLHPAPGGWLDKCDPFCPALVLSCLPEPPLLPALARVDNHHLHAERQSLQCPPSSELHARHIPHIPHTNSAVCLNRCDNFKNLAPMSAEAAQVPAAPPPRLRPDPGPGDRRSRPAQRRRRTSPRRSTRRVTSQWRRFRATPSQPRRRVASLRQRAAPAASQARSVQRGLRPRLSAALALQIFTFLENATRVCPHGVPIDSEKRCHSASPHQAPARAAQAT